MPRRPWIPATVAALFVATVLWGIGSRLLSHASQAEQAKAAIRLSVAVVSPRPAAAAQELVLPASVQAYLETPIYARTNGYLKRWLVDMGSSVKEGELLAEIDTPEIDQELRQAQAAEAQAVANREIAAKTAARWQKLVQAHNVSQQEADQNTAAYRAREADVLAAQANVRRLLELQSFKEVRAPFDGIVTARYVDVGALIANGTAQQLFHMGQAAMLRVYANVPQTYSRSIAPGLDAELDIPEFPERKFPGKVMRSAMAIDPASRTLYTEVQVPNADGSLLPGMFGRLRFHLPQASVALLIPANTLLFRAQGTQVATVDDQATVHLKTVVLGRDLSTSLEVLGGLTGNDRIVLNPPDSIGEGEGVVVEKVQDWSPPQLEPASP